MAGKVKPMQHKTGDFSTKKSGWKTNLKSDISTILKAGYAIHLFIGQVLPNKTVGDLNATPTFFVSDWSTIEVDCWHYLWNLTCSVMPLVLALHNRWRYIYPSIHPLYLSPSFSALSSLPACSINGFSCIIWAGVLELMEWGGWHGFQSHSSCPVPFSQFPILPSAHPPFSEPFSNPSLFGQFPFYMD